MKRLFALTVLSAVAAFNIAAKEIDQQETASIRNINKIEIREQIITGVGVIVNSIRTSINVIPESRDDLFVSLKGEATTNSKRDIPRFEIDKSGRTLRITLAKGRGVRFFLIRKGELTLDVHVPKKYKETLSVDVSSTRVFIGKFKLSELIAHTSSGSLTVDDIQGEAITIEASSGDVNISECTAEDLRIKTSSGMVKAGKLTAGKSEISASSGDIRIDSLIGSGSVHTSSGGIRIVESNGTIALKASSGDIKVLGAEGSYKVEISSGDLEMDFNGNPGDIEVRGSSGRITIKELCGYADITSTSGDIEAEYTEFQDDSRFKASSGEINLELPDGSSFVLDARTSSGRIRVDFPVTVEGEIKKDRICGSIGKNGPKLGIKTSSGDIEVRSK